LYTCLYPLHGGTIHRQPLNSQTRKSAKFCRTNSGELI
jgi:hypothetical protein